MCRNLFRLHAARYCDIIWGKGKVPLHIIQVTYSWLYITSALQTSSQLHAPSALTLVKEPPTRNEVWYAPEPVWTFQGDILLALPGIEPRFLTCPPSSLVTIPTELTRLLWNYITYVYSVQGWEQLWPILKYLTSLRLQDLRKISVYSQASNQGCSISKQKW